MMSLMTRLSKAFFYRLLMVFVLLVSLLIFFMTTTPGLYLVSKTASMVLPGQLHIDGISGQLINHLAFKQLHYESDDIVIEIKDFSLNWHPQNLLKKKLTIHQLQADQVKIDIRAAKEQTTQTNTLPSLPFALDVKQVHVNQLMISQNDSKHQLDNIDLQNVLMSENLQVNKLTLIYANHQLSLKTLTQAKWPFKTATTIQLAPLSTTEPGYEGQLQMTGDANLFQWQGVLNKPSPLRLQGSLSHLQNLAASARWADIDWPLSNSSQLITEQGHLLISGKLPNLQINLETAVKKPWAAKWVVNAKTNLQGIIGKALVESAEGNFDLDLSYQTRQSPKIHGKLIAQGHNRDNFPLKEMSGRAEFNGDSPETLKCHTVIYAQYFGKKLEGILTYQQQNLDALVKLGDNQLKVNHKAYLPWQVNAMLTNPSLLHPSLQGLQTTISIDASIENEQKGRLQLTIDKGSYKTPESQVLAFQGAKIQARLGKQALTGEGNFVIDPQKIIKLTFNMPDFQWQKATDGSQIIDSDAQLSINSLAFLQQIEPLISEASGQLQANLHSTGSLTNSQITGKLALQQGSLSINKLGIHLQPINVNLISENKQWKLQGEIASNGHALILSGQGLFAPEVNGKLSLNGESIPLINTPEYLIVLSPDLHLEFSPALVKLTGIITVPKALISPQSFNNSVNLTDDVVFAGDNNAINNPLHIDTDLQVIMGNEVALAAKGLQGLLTGGIHIRQLAQGPLNATGELAIREGKYKAYGQDLAIEQGQLIFTGGQLTNPGLELRAIREFSNTGTNLNSNSQLFDFNPDHMQTLDFGDKTTVGIEASGHLLSPKIRLFSNPPTLSQSDILSMLLLGKPASQANQAGGQLLLTAISSMNLGGGSKGMQLMEQIKQKFGFDLNLTNNTQYNQKTNQTTENTGVVVGKSLSKRIYVSYNVGLSQADSNVLTLKYLLNKFFSVQVNASVNASGVDLLYTRHS